MEEDEISNDNQEQEFGGEVSSEGEIDMGFDAPLPNPNATPMSKDKRPRPVETTTMKELKKNICKVLSRYPTLVPRSSNLILEKLNEMSEGDLENVYQNCLNDLIEIRGTPVAKFSIFILTTFIDSKFLPGFTDECMRDLELKRDIEAEIINLLGELNNRINIVFRFFNNGYIAYKKARHEYIEEGLGSVNPQNASSTESPFVKPIEIGQESKTSKNGQ